MSNSVDNSPPNSPTAATSPPPISANFWCVACDRVVSLLGNSFPLLCPRCRADRLRPQPRDPYHVQHPPLPVILSSYPSPTDDGGLYPQLDVHEGPEGTLHPAPKSSIDAIPDVEITADFLGADEDSCILCAVCKDQLAVGSEAKLLPCAHVYHGDCIVPWLSRSNSCPVCRSRLPVAVGEEGGRERLPAARRSVPVATFADSMEEEGGSDALVRAPAGGNRTWFPNPILCEATAAGALNDRRTVSLRWVMERAQGAGIGDGVENDGEGRRSDATVDGR